MIALFRGYMADFKAISHFIAALSIITFIVIEVLVLRVLFSFCFHFAAARMCERS